MSNPTDASCLTLDIDRNGDTAVVRCSGRLITGVNGPFYLKVSQLIPTSKRIVLDLTNLTHMDSTGIGTVVRLYVSARSSGCELQLVNLGQRIRELLRMTNVLSIFSVCGEHNIRT